MVARTQLGITAAAYAAARARLAPQEVQRDCGGSTIWAGRGEQIQPSMVVVQLRSAVQDCGMRGSLSLVADGSLA